MEEEINTPAVNQPNKGVIRIRLATQDQADNFKLCLDVDEELQPTKITRQITVDQNMLIISFTASHVKLLRVAINSMFDMLSVCAKTIVEFEEKR